IPANKHVPKNGIPTSDTFGVPNTYWSKTTRTARISEMITISMPSRRCLPRRLFDSMFMYHPQKPHAEVALHRGHGEFSPFVAGCYGSSTEMTRAQQTYFAATKRNGDMRFNVNDLILPERVLDPDETVYDVAMGGLNSDTFPLVLVTDRRVIHTKDQPWRRCRILQEAPWADILGAGVEASLLWGRLRVRIRGGKDTRLDRGDGGRREALPGRVGQMVDGAALSR